MATYRIILPGRLPGLNEVISANRAHWSKGAKQKKSLTECLAWHIKAQIKHPVGKATYHFKWVEKDKRRDKDNVASGKKFFMDALQMAGIINNDGWKQVAGFADEFEVDAKNPRVEIEIIEVELC
jgi:Holliday junction resolvase RusA-like endonuclease